VVALGVWLLILKADYRSVERVFLVASAVYLAYVASGIMAKPPWPVVARALVTPTFRFEAGYVAIAVTAIGTTIAPWMQFYQQASIVDKGLKVADYAYERLDVIIGSVFAVFVAAFIIIACAATLNVNGVHIETAKDAALALRPLVRSGPYASALFALGLLNASIFSAAILPLSTAYLVCEAFGWKAGVSYRLKEAPVFFGLYTAFIVLGAAIILLPIRSLVLVMLASQTLNGILLPVILVVMLRLVNDRRLMGKFVNGRLFNVLTYATVVLLVALTVILLITTLFPGFLGGG
jgi:Mn2+/Fe2+ NRAMP family transporter